MIKTKKEMLKEIDEYTGWRNYSLHSDIEESKLDNDAEVILCFVNKFKTWYCGGDDFAKKTELVMNKPFMLEFLAKANGFYPYLADEFKNDRDIALAAITRDENVFSCVPHSLATDKQFVHEALSRNGLVLGKLGVEDRKKKEFVLSAVTQTASAYELSSKARHIRNDLDIAKAALMSDGKIFDQLPNALQANRELALIAVCSNPDSFSKLSPLLRGDRELTTIAVQGNGRNLGNAPLFKDDIDIVIDAVTQNGGAIQFASDVFRANKDIVMLSLSDRAIACEAFKSIDSAFYSDYDVVKRAVSLDGGCLGLAAYKFRDSHEFADIAVGATPARAYVQLSDRLKQDNHYVLAALKDVHDGSRITNTFPSKIQEFLAVFNYKDGIEALEKLVNAEDLAKKLHANLSTDKAQSLLNKIANSDSDDKPYVPPKRMKI